MEGGVSWRNILDRSGQIGHRNVIWRFVKIFFVAVVVAVAVVVVARLSERLLIVTHP